MRRNTKVVPIFRTQLNFAGGAFAQSSTPVMGIVNPFGALWVSPMGSGPGGVGSGTIIFGPDNADGVAVSATNTDQLVLSRGTLFDGVDWDRSYSASGTNEGTFSSVGAAMVAPPGNWAAFQTPAAATQATCNRAGLAGNRNICNSIQANVSAVAIQGVLVLVLRDGASGVGAILWSTNLGPVVIGSNIPFAISGLNIVGTSGNQMTLEFTAAPAATNFESVAMTGYQAPT